jgi:hypothetical protein
MCFISICVVALEFGSSSTSIGCETVQPYSIDQLQVKKKNLHATTGKAMCKKEL